MSSVSRNAGMSFLLTRTHRLTALALASLSLLVACATTPAQAARRELRFTGPQITRQLAPSFPLKRCVFGNLACVRLQNPVVRMQPNDQRLFLDLKVQLQPLPGQGTTSGTAQVAGIPAYDPRQGAFYLRSPELLDLSVAGLGIAEARQISSLVSGMLGDEFFSDQPLWTLDESDPRQSMARLTLRSVAVRNGTLIVTLGDDDEPVDPDSVTPHTPHNLAPDGSRRSDRSDSNNRRGSHGSSRGNGNSSGNDTDGGDDSRGSDGRDDSDGSNDARRPAPPPLRDGNESTPAPGNGTEEGGGSSVWL
jgi:lipoprotein